MALAQARIEGAEAEMTGCIVGWSHLPFGKRDGETVESLITQAARGALDHAGVPAGEIDEIFLGHFNR
jgi:acetyl-CoA C-acetyltransferase